jgi:hypothetical protein
MAFVKLDCGILNSTLWVDREAREIFITALLMAVPRQLKDPEPTMSVDSLKTAKFVIPVGYYGMVEAAGPGIVRMAGLENQPGMKALRRLTEPDDESRSQDFDGRRLVRVDGGYIILNYDKYRTKDHTARQRMRDYRERERLKMLRRNEPTLRVTERIVTQVEAEVEVQAEKLRKKKEIADALKKKKENARPQNLDAVKVFFIQNDSNALEAERCWCHYESNGWTVGGKTPIVKWRMAAKKWILNPLYGKKVAETIALKPEQARTPYYLRTSLEACESRLLTLRQSKEMLGFYSESEKKELAELKAKKIQLEKEMAQL